MKYSDYSHWTERATQWIEKHFATIREKPVRAQTNVGDIAARLPKTPPEQPVDMETIISDFEKIVPDGITHWQHPRFFAYFQSNAAPASMIAEQLTNAIASQCMLWQTSPAATEIEEVIIDWFRQAMDLPNGFKGVIQDSASSATLSAVLSMREHATSFTGNDTGLSQHPRLRIYCSSQVHSSVDKACWIAGIGQENLIKIPTNTEHQIHETSLHN